jgi:Fe-S-cluster containining protein
MATKRISAKTKDEEALSLSSCPNKCGHCCQYGSGYVLLDEIKNLAMNFKITEEEFKSKYLMPSLYKKAMKFKIKKKEGKPYGSCIFYEGTCTIHGIKPLHCRIGTCNEHGQDLSTWFMINHLIDPNDENEVMEYITFLKFGNNIPGCEVENIVSQSVLKKLKGKKGGQNGRE